MDFRALAPGLCLAGACLAALVGYWEDKPYLYVLAVVLVLFVALGVFGNGSNGNGTQGDDI